VTLAAVALSVGLLGAVAAPSGSATTLWLVVGASDPSPAGIAHVAKRLAPKSSGALTFQTADCGEKRNVFGVALETVDSQDLAKAALERWRGVVKDAYIKRCAVVPGSLLALRFPVVAPSIADVPDDAVNWGDSDRVSTAVRLSDGRELVTERFFMNDPEDSLEGRRVRVLFAGGTAKGKVLSDDCASPEQFAVRDGLLAFQCAGAEAGDQLLHTVLVFDSSGNQVAKIESCRKPTFPDAATVACSEESVNAKGRLKLRSKQVALKKGL
jgi:hypothetical protein